MTPHSKLFMPLPTCPRSMTSLIGLLLSLLACSMALVISSTDQSGQRLAELSLAFQNSVSGHGINRDQSSADSTRLLSFRNADCDFRPTIRDATDRRSIRKTHIFSDENEPGVLRDAKEPAFLNLLSELQRFCRVSAVDTFRGELAIDLLWPSEKSDAEIVARICDVIQSLRSQSEGLECECQLTVWAASPMRSAFLDAALRAAMLHSLVQEHQTSLSTDSLRLSSSGQIWNSKNALRPVVTLVIRRIGRTRP